MTTYVPVPGHHRSPLSDDPTGPSGNRRLFAAAGPTLVQHGARFGPFPTLSPPSRLIGLLDDAGLSGRGGAGFPTGRKMSAISGRRSVVIANGAEGEPASGKDAVLLRTAPHLVLDGLALAAAAVGARETHLYAPAPALDAVRRALDERRAAGWDRHKVHLTEAPDRFISGEESAVINRIEGRPALPSDRLVRVTDSGLHGRPTLVQNVETLAHVALIARYGPRWFRSTGTPTEPGTMLITLSGTAAPGVLEVPIGIPLARLLDDYAAVDPAAVRAVLLGGFHGAWVPGAQVPEAALSREALQPLGATPGAGVVLVLGTHECGLQKSADISRYLAEQSARQCGPCLNGLPAIANVLTQLAYRRPAPNSAREVQRLTNMVEGRGACKHPDGTARFVRSAMNTFAHDVGLHLRGRCEATIPAPPPTPRTR